MRISKVCPGSDRQERDIEPLTVVENRHHRGFRLLKTMTRDDNASVSINDILRVAAICFLGLLFTT